MVVMRIQSEENKVPPEAKTLLARFRPEFVPGCLSVAGSQIAIEVDLAGWFKVLNFLSPAICQIEQGCFLCLELMAKD